MFLIPVPAILISVLIFHFDIVFAQPPIQLVVPPGDWNLTNNAFPSWLIPALPLYSNLFVTAQVRMLSYIHSGFYELWTFYDPVAVGRYFNTSKIKRPSVENTVRNKNIALCYHFFRIQTSWFPNAKNLLIPNMRRLGLDENFTSTDPTIQTGDYIAAAIGNKVAQAVYERSIRDGFNQLGDYPDNVVYGRRNFSDYTEYEPINTVKRLNDPDRWQPNYSVDSKSRETSQLFVTPQLGLSQPWHIDPMDTECPEPKQIYKKKKGKLYRKKTDEVISFVSNLTDYQKMTAEWFDNKVFGIGAMSRALYGDKVDTYEIDHYLSTVPLVNLAMLDGMIATWYHKKIYDAVRPFSAIRFLYGDSIIQGYGGPGKDSISLKGKEWKSYLPTDAFPEYPSGTTCLCWAFTGAAQTFLKTDSFNFTYVAPKGSSVLEPGLTPKQDLTIRFDTFTQMAEICGLSRIWSGVHFREAVEKAKDLCYPIGQEIGRLHYDMVHGISS